MASYEYAYVVEEVLGTGILSALFSGIPSMLIGIAAYVLTALALYTMAQRRGLNRPWLAWIPVVNCWIVGSLSDQYRYVVKDEIKSKRKVLLILRLIMAVLGTAMTAVALAMVFSVVGTAMRGGVSEEQMVQAILGPAVGIVGMCLPLAGVSIAYAILRYMALYDIYRSMDPANCVLYLVLSILFGVTEPFFLFFNRNKDLGMPPRRQQETVYQEPVYIPDQPVQEPWEQEDKDYL